MACYRTSKAIFFCFAIWNLFFLSCLSVQIWRKLWRILIFVPQLDLEVTVLVRFWLTWPITHRTGSHIPTSDIGSRLWNDIGERTGKAERLETRTQQQKAEKWRRKWLGERSLELNSWNSKAGGEPDALGPSPPLVTREGQNQSYEERHRSEGIS